jgi:hypothetical protein
MNALIVLLALTTAPDGSVIFWQDGLFVRPIQRQTGSHLTHAAVILDGYVYEASPPRVRKVPLNQYLKEMEAKAQKRAMKRRGFKIVLMQPRVPYSLGDVQAMIAYAESQLGRPYSIRGWWKGQEVRGVFCSEYAGNVLERGGRIKSGGVEESPGSLHQKLEPIYR